MSASSAQILPPRIGRFELCEKVGSGGMGDVYQATDTHLKRKVALKLLPEKFSRQLDRLERFENEARAASALNHPNIATVYDAGVSNGIPWIAMEFVEGRTLAKMVRQDGPLAVGNALALATQLASGLARAHEAGIVHCDLKPENIMVTPDGCAKLLDFGLARLNAEDSPVVNHDGPKVFWPKEFSSVTETLYMSPSSMVGGTPGYMSPEQVLGAPINHHTDQFAMGALMYEMLSGANPFWRPTAAQTWSAILETNPPSLDGGRPEVPAKLAGIVARCLAKDPQRRYSSTRQLVAELENCNEQQPPRSYKAFHNRFLAAGSALLMALVVLAGVDWMKTRRPVGPTGPSVLAVRTFKYLASDPAQEYVSTGLSEELRSQLAKISSIRMLGGGMVDQYADKDLRQLASQFGASQILDGTVRVDKQRIRVAVQLTSATSNQVIWAEEYDRPLEDILALQSDLALRITAAMKTVLTPQERRQIESRPTKNATAWDLYLQASNLGMANRDKSLHAIALEQRAVELDPHFAMPMADIASRLAYLGKTQELEQAIGWAKRAIENSPNAPDGYQALALIYERQGADSKARAALLHALELDPNGFAGMGDLAITLSNDGRPEEGLHWARMLLERNGAEQFGYYYVSNCLIQMRDHPAIERWFEVWSKHVPNSGLIHQMRAVYTVEKGGLADGLAEARRLHEAEPANVNYQVLLADLALMAEAPDAEGTTARRFNGAEESLINDFVFLPESAKLREAYFRLQKGENAVAAHLLREAKIAAQAGWDSDLDTPTIPAQLAAVAAMQHDTERAFQWLERAYERGLREPAGIRFDPMLKNLRSDPRFARLIQRMEDDMANQGRNSTEISLLFSKTVPALPPPRQ